MRKIITTKRFSIVLDSVFLFRGWCNYAFILCNNVIIPHWVKLLDQNWNFRNTWWTFIMLSRELSLHNFKINICIGLYNTYVAQFYTWNNKEHNRNGKTLYSIRHTLRSLSINKISKGHFSGGSLLNVHTMILSQYYFNWIFLPLIVSPIYFFCNIFKCRFSIYSLSLIFHTLLFIYFLTSLFYSHFGFWHLFNIIQNCVWRV